MDLKTSKSRRDLPLPASVVVLLRDHKTRQRFALGDAWSEGGYVFVSAAGTPLDSRNVTQRFQRALAAAGVRRMRFHDLRHSAATWLLLAGVPDRVIMAQLGHSQLSTTAIYAHVVDTMLTDAAGLMDGILVRAHAQSS